METSAGFHWVLVEGPLHVRLGEDESVVEMAGKKILDMLDRVAIRDDGMTEAAVVSTGSEFTLGAVSFRLEVDRCCPAAF